MLGEINRHKEIAIFYQTFTVPDIEALIGGTRARRRNRCDVCFHTLAIFAIATVSLYFESLPLPSKELNMGKSYQRRIYLILSVCKDCRLLQKHHYSIFSAPSLLSLPFRSFLPAFPTTTSQLGEVAILSGAGGITTTQTRIRTFDKNTGLLLDADEQCRRT